MQRTRTQYKEQTERGGYLYPLETYRFHFNLENKNKPQICVSYHWHPELEILMIERGELTVTIEDREYTGKTGDLFFVNPGFLHTMYAREGKNTVYNAIVFDPAFLSFQMYDYVQSHYLAPLLSGRLRFPEKLEKAGTEFPALFQMLRDVLASNEHRYACYQFETKPLPAVRLYDNVQRKSLYHGIRTLPENFAGTGGSDQGYPVLYPGSLSGKNPPGGHRRISASVPQIFQPVFQKTVRPFLHGICKRLPGGTVSSPSGGSLSKHFRNSVSLRIRKPELLRQSV